MGKISNKGFSKNVYPKDYHDKPAESKFEADPSELKQIEKALKPLVITIVERAFRRFAKAHGVKPEQEEIEWSRFKKILSGML